MPVKIIQQSESPDIVKYGGVIIPCVSAGDCTEALQLLGLNTGAGHICADFDPSAEESLVAYINGSRVILTGLSRPDHYGRCRQVFQLLGHKLWKNKREPHLLMLSHLDQDAGALHAIADAAINGLLLGNYVAGVLKSKKESPEKDVTLDIWCDDPDIESIVQVAQTAAYAQREVFDLVNLPSSHKTPETLAEWAVRSGERFGYTVEVMDEIALADEGFEALLAVNRGSVHAARMIICQYDGVQSQTAPLLAFIGKGVTFDTGGISLKPGNNLHLMKSDMGGAGAVLGAIELLARMKAPVRVIACAPCTDNSIDARAIKPGDVIGSYSGKTIEVINTDAEGRLILADALAFVIRNFKPDVVIDLATLTGSIVRALGTYCAGLFTHSDDLATALIQAGDHCGERLWRMPLWEDYAEEIKSDIADIKNLSDKPAGGSITAAKFLEHFVEGHHLWAHLDIAAVVLKANGVVKSHTATAFGLRLLYEFALRYR